MGLTYSSAIVSDPAAFASPVDDASDKDRWREYDYIIVGGGTAGCVLASRLSEDRNVTVLLIEAGKSYEGDFPTRIPLAYTKLFKSEVDWDYVTTPQNGMNSRRVHWPRGKILGGTSTINAMIYHRCAPEDFDEWERLGATGWSYADLRPYFDKAERYAPSTLYPQVRVEEHGLKGPWQTNHTTEFAVSRLSLFDIPTYTMRSKPILDTILNTCEEVGIPYNHDVNSPRGTIGATRLVGCIDDGGRRSSSATAYLTADVLKRPNLTVAVHSTVERILFAHSANANPRAVGVEISKSKTSPRYRAYARGEVILCAGTIVTPQLLLVSGIGSSDDLRKLDIEVVRDLPAVGRNLKDHLTTGPVRFRTKADITWDRYNQPLHGVIAFLRWLFAGSGPLSALGTSTAAFVRSDDPKLSRYWEESTKTTVRDATSGPSAPDMELFWFPLLFGMEDGVVVPTSGSYGVTMAASLLRPESTGQIILASRSIWDKPVIDPRYLESENDINVAVRATRLLCRMARAEPLNSLLDWTTTEDTDYFWPGNTDPSELSDDALKQWIRDNANPIFHPVASARMGKDPQTSVVDPELRVHGIAGLRVVDASAFPAQVSGHPCAVVVAMAEKAAELIKVSASQ
ncbi:GMC oxidoreductase [Rhodofomes roseus]|uniref:GMC oxidoreductase n=1 Tax=Rhodofomes roseus TaxID=34475 RepID=A0ABQ8KPL0_9APHY|nr:GMC oxidoreductase [Rhodofomes roseus]KAH9840159.1 GMC oxidoreductase [Rhodofomes roseus]